MEAHPNHLSTGKVDCRGVMCEWSFRSWWVGGARPSLKPALADKAQTPAAIK